MSGWSILTWGVVCSAGVLLFMRLVVDTIAGAEEALRMLGESERKKHGRRLETTPYLAEPSEDAEDGSLDVVEVAEEAA